MDVLVPEAIVRLIMDKAEVDHEQVCFFQSHVGNLHSGRSVVTVDILQDR